MLYSALPLRVYSQETMHAIRNWKQCCAKCLVRRVHWSLTAAII
jgi:hypothetical protein